MSYPMHEIYKFLKKNKDLEVTVDREDDDIRANNITGIYAKPKAKIVLENSGDHFQCVSIYFEDEKFKVAWGTVTLESEFSGETEFEDHTELIRDLEENL